MTHGTRRLLSGIAASPGWALGPAFVYRPVKDGSRRECPPESGLSRVSTQVERFKDAVETQTRELASLKDRAEAVAGADEAGVFEAHCLMLKDPELEKRVVERIRDGLTAEDAVRAAVEHFAAGLEALKDPYLAQRAADVRDVGNRLLLTLEGRHASDLTKAPEGSIIVARDLAPSETIQLEPGRTAAIATSRGGPTAHTAIFARAMGLPAVVGIGPELDEIRDGDLVLVHGDTGEVIIHPTPADIDKAKDVSRREGLRPSAPPGEARTRDGLRVEVSANIGHPHEADLALREGADGVGLFRSEFLYLEGTRAPDENEQLAVYSHVLKTFQDRPVIVRTLDIGGDKPVSYLPLQKEDNPFMGWRGIRVCLEHRDLFETQLRALLRASVHGKLRVMLPMVTDLSELLEAKESLRRAKETLRARGQPFDESLSLGIMVETPAAVLLAHHLAREAAFFSLGTNDLAQYTLAVDRTNERVSPLYRAEHPAVLRLVAATVEAARAEGRWVGICGELAGDLDMVPILVGLGLDELSVAPSLIAPVKNRVATLNAGECQELAVQALKCSSPEEVRHLVRLAAPKPPS
ncbi:MAG TPA: phosphoenolpyruvate--protein phosphotransferase [Clostridiales bacterium]|nr:phosphoenolpyruvate--protein phosphotransferase [Clostridiales bacterium]